MSTVCLECGVATAVGVEMGYMGLPSLDEEPRGRGRHRLSARLSSGGDADTDETFGYLYSGMRAVSLSTHALETYRAFLKAHSGRGHRLFEWTEDVEDLPDGYGDATPRFVPYRQPRRAPGFVRARVRFCCARCGVTFESSGAEWVRPRRGGSIPQQHLQRFMNCTVRPAEYNIRDAWPFQITLFDDFQGWLTAHARHGVSIELLPERPAGTAPARGRQPRMAPVEELEPWQPPRLPPEEDERVLGVVPDEALPLLAGLHHREAAVRATSAAALKDLSAEGTLTYLVPLLDDPVEEVRLAAIEVVGGLPGLRRLRLLGLALLDESESVRLRARHFAALAGVPETALLERARAPRARLEPAPPGGKRGRPLAEVLRQAVSPDGSRRGSAAHDLSRFREPLATQMLLALLDDQSEHVVGSAAFAAGSARRREATVPLVAVANGAGKDLRRTIVRALGAIGDERCLSAIAAALDDDDDFIRSEAIQALGEFKDTPEGHPLARALDVERPEMRAQAARLLGERGFRSGVRRLLACLTDEARSVRWAAAQALAELNDPGAIQPLVDASLRGDAVVSGGAHQVLIREGVPGTEDALVRGLDEYGVLPEEAMATRYVLSEHEPLVSAGRAALGQRKLSKDVKAVRWGSGRP